MKEQSKGALLMAISAVFFSIGGVLIKMIPWGALATNGGRCIFGVIVYGIYLMIAKKKLVINGPTLLGALGIMGTTFFYNTATKFTTAANAIILEYTSPIFIVLMLYLFFHKKPCKADIIATVAVVFGIFWFFLDSLSTGHYLGDALGLCSAVCVSVVYVLKLNPRADLASLIFFGLLASSVAFGPFIAQESVFTPTVLCWVAALGVFQLGFAYIFFFLGLSRCNPVPAVLAGSLEPILNPVWVAIFYGEMISPLAMPGIAVVLITVLTYNIVMAKKE